MARKPKLQKYPEFKGTIEGKAETGKTTLAIAFARELSSKTYLWSTDGRIQEYVSQVGEGKILIPDEEVDTLDALEVMNAIKTDKKAGEFKDVNLIILDNATHLYQEITRRIQVEKLEGSKESFAMKAHVMRNMLSAIMRPQIPFIILLHQYMAGDQYGKNKKLRPSLSETEVDRLNLALNAKLLTMEYKDRYAVKVLECRQYPAMKPFILVDEVGMFEGMPARIQEALYDHQGVPPDAQSLSTHSAPKQPQPTKWEDFNEEQPFPKKDIAIRMAIEYYKEYDGQKVYPFGDPAVVPVKQDGEEGINGAVNVANRCYKKVREHVFGETINNPKWKTANPKKDEQYRIVSAMMTKEWKQRVEERIEEAKAPSPAPDEVSLPLAEEAQEEMPF